MIKWEIVNKDLVVTPSSLLVPVFKQLYDIDLDLLKYVYLTCDITEENPLRSSKGEDREKRALEMSIKQLPKDASTKALLVKAKDCYTEFNKTSADRFLSTIDDKLDEIRDVLGSVKVEIKEGTDKNGNTVWNTNASIITTMMEKVDSIQAKRESIEKRSIKESAKLKSRGNQERSALMKGEIKTNAW